MSRRPAAEDVVRRLLSRVRDQPEQAKPFGGRIVAAPRATPEQVRHSEERLGFELPVLLRRIYVEVANGGFGPGYGVMGIAGGFTDDLGQTAVDARDAFLRGAPDCPDWSWPSKRVPMCYWGCTVYSVVDCGSLGAPVEWIDVGDETPIVQPHKATLEEWLDAWLEGRDLWMDR